MSHSPALSRGGAIAWRADINGLRALAVLAVLGYHFFPDLLLAGFIGVDIFFVISGYLITQILARALAGGTFSIVAFYEARVRRIFPALALVLASVLAAGWLWLYEGELARVGRQAAGGASFVSNLLLWRESGYFDLDIASKPLAHLWSLGVEEQFYIAWPWLLWLAVRSRRPLRILAGLAVLSFIAGIVVLPHDQPAAFYLPVFRFWELSAGALLALATGQGRLAWLDRHAGTVSLAGFVLLLAGFLLISGSQAFPGWWAVLPVAGTCLVIAAGPAAGCNRVLLGNAPMAWIGLVSYPLYLWHWPLLSFERIVFVSQPSWAGSLFLVGLSFVLAALTWHFVETPARAPVAGRRKVLALVAVMITVASIGLLASSGSKLFATRAAPVLAMRPMQFFKRNPWLVDDCRLARPEERGLVMHCVRDARGAERFALVGDSKAEALFEGLVRTSSPSGRWLFFGGSLAHTSMVPVITNAPAFRADQPVARLGLETLTANPRIETVVIASATRALFQLHRGDSIEELADSPEGAVAAEGLRRFVTGLVHAGKKVVLLVDNPTLLGPEKCLRPVRYLPPEPFATWFSVHQREGCSIALQRHRELSVRYRQLLADVQQVAPQQVAIFDTMPFLCDPTTGICSHSDGRGFLYSYADHISAYAAAKIGASLNPLLLGSGASAGGLFRAAGSSAAPAAPSADSRG